jgi:hypothetical protein
MAGISVERPSYRPRAVTPEIAVPRTRIAVSEKVRDTDRVLGNIDVALQNLTEKPRQDAGLGQWISYFDFNSEKEGLPSDWQNLRTLGDRKEIGFSMNMQMGMLENATDKKSVSEWTKKTKQDLIGFKIEYLTDHLVYPCAYERNADGSRLESRDYGNLDMVDTVSATERNGSVKRSLEKMKAFFLSENTPDGAIAVMASPKGDAGIKTDDGKRIDYPDSYFFIMQKKGDKVENFTLKTDFSLHESREAIYQLTGKRLSPFDRVETYVDTVATIKPGEKEVKGVSGVVKVLEQVRNGQDKKHAFEHSETREKIGWGEVYKDIQNSAELYNFNKTTQQVIDKFEEYCQEANHTKEELQKAIAATILRMSELFFKEKGNETAMQQDTWYDPYEVKSFGDVLKGVSARPGCAGGGGGSFISSFGGGARMGVVGGSSQEWFTCPKCHHKADGPVGNTCPGCGLTKEAYAIESGVSCN